MAPVGPTVVTASVKGKQNSQFPSSEQGGQVVFSFELTTGGFVCYCLLDF